MHSRPSPRLSVTILLTILAGLLAALAGILGNLAASTIPPAIIPYLRFAWPAFGVVVVLGIGVSVWQVRRDAIASSRSHSVRQKSASPSPAPTPAQQQNTPSDYHTCVLSYATEDQIFVEKLHANLQQPELASPNVAKKLLEWKYVVEILRNHLRTRMEEQLQASPLQLSLSKG